MKKHERKSKKNRRRAEAYGRKIVRLREDSAGQSRKPALLIQQESLERQARLIAYGMTLAKAYAGMPKIDPIYLKA